MADNEQAPDVQLTGSEMDEFADIQLRLDEIEDTPEDLITPEMINEFELLEARDREFGIRLEKIEKAQHPMPKIATMGEALKANANALVGGINEGMFVDLLSAPTEMTNLLLGIPGFAETGVQKLQEATGLNDLEMKILFPAFEAIAALPDLSVPPEQVPFGQVQIREGLDAVGLGNIIAEPDDEAGSFTSVLNKFARFFSSGAGVLGGLKAKGLANRFNADGTPKPKGSELKATTSATENTGKALTEEAVISGFGAGGSEVGELSDLSPGEQAAAEVMSIFAGVGMMSASKAAWTRFQAERLALDPTLQTAAKVQTIAGGAEEALKAADEVEANELLKDLPVSGLRKTTNPGLLSLERAIMKDPKFQALALQSDREMNEFFKQQFSSIAGEDLSDEFVGQLRASAERASEMMTIRTENAIAQAQEAIEQLPAGPNVIAESSEIASEALDAALKDSRDHETILWNRARGKYAGIPSKDIKKALVHADEMDAFGGDVLANFPNAAKARQLINELPENVEDFNTIQSLRSHLLEAQRQARADKKFTLSKRLGVLSESVNDAMKKAGNHPEVVNARTFSIDLNDNFTRGPIGRVLGFSDNGGRVTADELLLSKLLRGDPDGNLNFAALEEATSLPNLPDGSPNPRAAEVRLAQEEMLLKTIQKTVVGDSGNISRAAVSRFRNKHEALLERYPEVKSQLDELASSAEEVTAATQANRDFTSTRSKNMATLYLDERNVTAKQATKKIIGSDNPGKGMDDAMRLMGRDPEDIAPQGFRSLYIESFAEEVFTAQPGITGERTISQNRFEKLYAKNRQAIKNHFGEDAVKALDQLQDELRLADPQAQRARIGTGSDTVQNSVMLDMFSRIGGAQLGRLIAKKTGGGTVQTPGIVSSRVGEMIEGLTQRASNRVMQKAFLSDKKLLELLRKPLAKLNPDEIKTLRGELLAVQGGATEEQE